MFLRRVTVKGKDGKSYTYLRVVRNQHDKGVSKQEIVVDFGAERNFSKVLQAISRFLGPAQFIRSATGDEDLARLSVVWHRLPPLARATIKAFIFDAEQQPTARSEDEITEALRHQIDKELQADVEDDVPLASARAAKVAR